MSTSDSPAALSSRAASGRKRLLNAFESVSVRLLGLILVSVLPLAIVGSLLAWHNYRSTLDASTTRATLLAEVIGARAQQRVVDVQRLLHALATQPEIRDPHGCAAPLRLARALQTVPLIWLGYVDAQGHSLCPAATDATALPGQDVIPHKLEVLLRGDGLVAHPVLRAVVPVADGSGFVVADMRLSGTRRELIDAKLIRPDGDGDGGTAAWFIDQNGVRVPFCSDCGWDLASQRTQDGIGRFFRPDLVDSVGILVTALPNKEERSALSLFVWHVGAIALLLALGLAAVAAGASVLIVAPLRAVTRSVAQWRRAGSYSTRHTRLTPIELRQLSRAFGQATRAVAAHEERLRRAEAKQELLIKEIHHRVKNNLQIIASLLNLQANRIRQPEARAEFASARDRVRALATLHRHLYSEGELHTLNMRPFLEELCGQLFQAIGEKEGRRIRLDIDAPEIVMSTDQAVPLALVVTEAVSNAIKYAFPGGRSGRVSVRLTEQVTGIAKLVIEDDGVGIPAGRQETETGIRDGIGIQLIRGFARQLGASLEVSEGDGTRYTLLVPLQPPSADTAGGAAPAAA